MLAGVALAYSFLVSFVLSCVSRNRRSNRPETPLLGLVGWALMSGSFAMAGFLFALAAMRVELG